MRKLSSESILALARISCNADKQISCKADTHRATSKAIVLATPATPLPAPQTAAAPQPHGHGIEALQPDSAAHTTSCTSHSCSGTAAGTRDRSSPSSSAARVQSATTHWHAINDITVHHLRLSRFP